MTYNSYKQSISADSVSVRLWALDHRWLRDFCQENNQKPSVVVRELFSEVVRLHNAGFFPNSPVNESEPSLIPAINSLSERIDHQEKVLSETYHLLVEPMMAVCSMNNLAWLQSRVPWPPRNGIRPDRDGMAEGGRPR